jgi:hypothetical protein
MVEGFPVQDMVDAYTEIEFKILHICVRKMRAPFRLLVIVKLSRLL